MHAVKQDALDSNIVLPDLRERIREEKLRRTCYLLQWTNKDTADRVLAAYHEGHFQPLEVIQ